MIESKSLPTIQVATSVWRYAMVNRPVGIGTCPKGCIRVEDRPAKGHDHYDYARNGVAVYDRKLSDHETKSFEMALMLEGRELDATAQLVAKDMLEYADEYYDMSNAEPSDFLQEVTSRIQSTAAGYPPSVGNLSEFVRKVSAILKKQTTASASPTGTFPPYTLGILLGANDPKIVSRVLRDLTTLKSVTTKQRMTLQVASASDILDPHLKELKIRRTPDLGQAHYWRVYYSGTPPEAPETANQVEMIQVDPPPITPKSLRLDPNFSEDVIYRDIKQIPPSIDIDKPAPWHNADPLAQDF